LFSQLRPKLLATLLDLTPREWLDGSAIPDTTEGHGTSCAEWCLVRPTWVDEAVAAKLVTTGIADVCGEVHWIVVTASVHVWGLSSSGRLTRLGSTVLDRFLST